MSPSTLGSGPWFCSAHFPPFRSMGAERYRPPLGAFQQLRQVLPRLPDPEAAAERAAIEGEARVVA
jgi:hypothetical protein